MIRRSAEAATGVAPLQAACKDTVERSPGNHSELPVGGDGSCQGKARYGGSHATLNDFRKIHFKKNDLGPEGAAASEATDLAVTNRRFPGSSQRSSNLTLS